MELVTTSNTATKEQTNMMTKKGILETSHRKSDSLGFISSTFFFVYNKQQYMNETGCLTALGLI